MSERLRCKDCKWCWSNRLRTFCAIRVIGHNDINPGQFACKKFVHKEPTDE